jgi:hypothetical protein
MKRVAMMIMAMAVLVSASITQAAQESKGKTMTAAGAVKTVTANSLAINDGPGKDWTFAIDSKTKILALEETINVPATSKDPGKVVPRRTLKVTDLKEGQRVEVKYRTANGKNLATQVEMK